VSFVQNHDQIGNRAFGERIHLLADDSINKAISAILCISPSIPMFYMGEEWGSQAPFFFFCDLGPELAPLVTEGRRNEFAKFKQFQDPAKRNAIPDPVNIETFAKSRLDWSDLEQKDHKEWLKLHKELLQVRKKHVMPLLASSEPPAARIALRQRGLMILEWKFAGKGTLRLVANLSDTEVSSEEIKQPAGTKLIFDSSSAGTAKVADSVLAPWSVRWLVENDTIQ
jgi:1,4-alpha-glucan branching enzyme